LPLPLPPTTTATHCHCHCHCHPSTATHLPPLPSTATHPPPLPPTATCHLPLPFTAIHCHPSTATHCHTATHPLPLPLPLPPIHCHCHCHCHPSTATPSPLTPPEARSIRRDPACARRLVASYELMLAFYGMRLADRRTGEIESVCGSGWVAVADSNAVGERGARRFGWWWSRLVSLCIGGAVDGQSLLNFLIGCGSRTGALGR
jgi:hypothetical protein